MAELLINFASGALTADPGTSGVTLTSGQFAFLPAVASPNTMRLSLDPDGLAGAPEIVIVTAHTASATTATVTRGQETSYGAGAARAHAVDTVWRHSLTHGSLAEIMVPAGTVTATVGATADPGYVLIDGSTVAGAQTLYPATWARIPAAWKSSADMVLPDWRGRMLVGDDASFTLGGSGGANTHAITQAELPAATITIDPPSTAVTGITDIANATHTHNELGTDPASLTAGSGIELSVKKSAIVASDNDTASATAPHQHGPGTLAVNIAPFASGNLGSGTAMSLLSAYGVVNFQLKVH